MHLTDLDFLLWAAGPFEYLLLLGVLYHRRLIGQLPIFTSFLAGTTCQAVALFFVFRYTSPKTYFYSFWISSVLVLILELGVVLEVTVQVLRPLGTWEPELRRSSLLIALFSLLAAAGLAWLASPPVHDIHQVIVLRGSLFASSLLGELLIFMSALSVFLRIPWKSHVARIAQGLGAYSIVELTVDGINGLHGVAGGTRTFMVLSHFRGYCYLLCIAYWIVMLARDAPRVEEYPDAIRQQLFVLQARLALDLQFIRSWKG